MTGGNVARSSPLRRILLALPFVVGLVTAMRTWSLHHGRNLMSEIEGVTALHFWWLFVVILACASMASLHADQLAHRLGEPLGTIVLTLSAIVIEVAMVAAVMLNNEQPDPYVARNTMFATLMIILNGLVGLALLIGGWRRHEQVFNLQSSSTYLSLIIPLATITLVLPHFTKSSQAGFMARHLEIFVSIACILVYASFLWLQTSRYRSFFSAAPEHASPTPTEPEDTPEVDGSAAEMRLLAQLEARFSTEDELQMGDAPKPAEPEDCHLRTATRSTPPAWRSATLLLLHLALVVVLAESLGEEATGMLTELNLPLALTGVLVAVLILAPEGLAAVVSAKRDSMQRTMNILLGSALSTIGLTAPAVLGLSMWLGSPVALGLEPAEIVLLVATLMLCMNNFLRGKVNTMQGIVHLTLFFAYCALLFD